MAFSNNMWLFLLKLELLTTFLKSSKHVKPNEGVHRFGFNSKQSIMEKHVNSLSIFMNLPKRRSARSKLISCSRSKLEMLVIRGLLKYESILMKKLTKSFIKLIESTEGTYKIKSKKQLSWSSSHMMLLIGAFIAHSIYSL